MNGTHFIEINVWQYSRIREVYSDESDKKIISETSLSKVLWVKNCYYYSSKININAHT